MIVLDGILRLSCKVHSPPSASKVILEIMVFPRVWMILPGLFDLKVIGPVKVTFIVGFKIRDP